MHSVRLGTWAATCVVCPLASGQDCLPRVTPTPGLSVLDLPASALHVHDDGTGPALYVGGWFAHAGSLEVGKVARWDGVAWSRVGPVLPPPIAGGVNSMTTHLGRLAIGVASPVISGPCVLEWDGSQWTVLASNRDIRAIASFGGDLYVGGIFNTIGGVTSPKVARWDGAAWHAMGSGVNGNVHSLAVTADGVAVGGFFTTAGGISSPGVARWSSGWHAMPAAFGLPLPPRLGLLDGQLYAGGFGGLEPWPFALARWDGAAWEGLASPLWTIWIPPTAWIGGAYWFGSAPQGNTAVARWSGGVWTPVLAHAEAPDDTITGMQVFEGALYVCGGFAQIGGQRISHIARIDCAAPPACYADCDGDGMLGVGDFGCFQGRFAQGAMYADCNQDFWLTVSDFGCFQTRFVAGCP